jgi:hypothetical protein
LFTVFGFTSSTDFAQVFTIIGRTSDTLVNSFIKEFSDGAGGFFLPFVLGQTFFVFFAINLASVLADTSLFIFVIERLPETLRDLFFYVFDTFSISV